MYGFLAVFGGMLGLFITGVAVYTAWLIHQLWKQQAAAPKPSSQTQIAAQYLSRWTFLDFATVGVFIIGMLLLLAELVAVLRDKAALENFHFAYLLSGILLSFMGMLLLVVRLLVVLGFKQPSVSSSAVSPDHHDQPNHAD
ncbi:hypothetical protein [Paenibacillus hexagrammi]|uniref:Uncharacterized protein n=1 Tax=Paenibacillus hexagrammi TaxID=2908839 RepID=A0ABY3SEA9_9BACL|nr:hypothetical protein [Paenibacillus sp. YPD9-1]UJF31531.1 hypothetical protein L0M14_17135 [Paenibacillus sp. YPD9-1]